jgi:predicted RecA/RadA family phage recombinase
MAINYVQPGKTITLVAPYQRNAGLGALVGSIFGVALTTVANGIEAEFAVNGVWDLAKTSAQAWVLGDKIYWDDTNKRCDNTAVGVFIGIATAVAANPSGAGRVRLAPTGSTASAAPPLYPVTTIAGDGAITIVTGIVRLTKGSAAAIALAAPSAGQAGTELIITAGSAYAHVVTATTLIEDGVTGGSKTTATFGAFNGATLTLRAVNLKWTVVSKNVVTIT